MSLKRILSLSILVSPIIHFSMADDLAPNTPLKQDQAKKYKNGFTVYEQEDFSVTLGGKIKLDGYYDVDAHQPGTTYGLDVANIPLKTGMDINAYKKGNYNYTLADSRISLDVQKKFFGVPVRGFLEFDFKGDNSTTTNNFKPRMRHAYVEGCGWLLGQTWYTFTDTDAFIFTFDNLYGTGRQATVRYTFTLTPEISFTVGADRPDTNLYQFAVSDGAGTLVSANTGFFDDDSSDAAAKAQYPDGAVKLQYKSQRGHFALRGVIRDLQVKSEAGLNDAVSTYKKDMLGWGVGVSTKYKVFECFSILAQATGGRGISTYIDDLNNSYQFDAVFIYPTTLAAEAVYKNSFKPVKMWNAIGGFELYLTDKISTNFAYSYTKVSKPSVMRNLQGLNFNRKLQRYIGNIVYDILPNSKVGLEVLHYIRKSGTPTQYGAKDTRILASFLYMI